MSGSRDEDRALASSTCSDAVAARLHLASAALRSLLITDRSPATQVQLLRAVDQAGHPQPEALGARDVDRGVPPRGGCLGVSARLCDRLRLGGYDLQRNLAGFGPAQFARFLLHTQVAPEIADLGLEVLVALCLPEALGAQQADGAGR